MPLPPNPVVLVVGASGRLGKQITQSFVNEKIKGKTLTIKALSRRSQTEWKEDVEWVTGDLLKPETLPKALEGVDIVVTSANGYMKETIFTDVTGNRNLIEACIQAGIKRFVFLSIVKCDQAMNAPHFAAKCVAEDLLKKSGMPFVVVRSPCFLVSCNEKYAFKQK